MTEKPFRPLLAAETPEDLHILEKLGHFPMYASYKIDGIRALVRGGKLVSRTMKEIPSRFAQQFVHPYLEGFDGELLAQKPVGPTIYHDTYSAAMTYGSMEPLDYHIFDVVGDEPYRLRQLSILEGLFDAFGEDMPEIKILKQHLVMNVEQILALEEKALEEGYEGLIVRTAEGRYKQGRSTLREGLLVKVKRMSDSEAMIVGFEELMHNDNTAETSALGFTKRSSHQENLRPSGMMGALLVVDVKTRVPFKIGTGFDHSLRKLIWENGHAYLGRVVKYKYLAYGVKEAPRHPSFIGFRDPMDM